VSGVAATAAGAFLIAVALRDVFDALFNPEGRAVLSRSLMRATWRLFRGRRSIALAGPAALIATVASWALLLLVGWALVWWPHIDDFNNVGVSDPGFADALYFSMVTLTTIGFGDVTPASDVLRVITPIEALLGFGLLTATVSWLLGVYPALSRRRSLAYEITLLREAEKAQGQPLTSMAPASLERILAELTSRLIAVERDLVTFPVSYYFRERDERFSLASAIPFLLELAERGSRDRSPDTRLRALMLRDAVADFARTGTALV
jgi:hypothetical protein